MLLSVLYRMCRLGRASRFSGTGWLSRMRWFGNMRGFGRVGWLSRMRRFSGMSWFVYHGIQVVINLG